MIAVFRPALLAALVAASIPTVAEGQEPSSDSFPDRIVILERKVAYLEERVRVLEALIRVAPWQEPSGSVSDSDVFTEGVVEEKASVLSATPPVYPELLKQAGIQGRVLIQAVIDTNGRAEPNSVRIIQSPNPAFDAGSRNYILSALFRPARIHGRAVRVLIQVPINFTIGAR